MRKIVFLAFLLLTSIIFSQEEIKKIRGIITDGFEPLQNVNILVKGTDIGIKTNKLGKYEIFANEGQTLVYSYVGKQPVEIIIEDVTEFLNIALYDRVEELEGVTVTKRKRKTQKDLLNEFNENKNLIKTGFGILDKERTGFSLRIIDTDDLNPSAIDFVTALENRIPGIKVDRSDPARPKVFLPRKFNSMSNGRPAAFEVDGLITADAPIYISLESMERIAVINTPIGLAKYGSIAAGGLIIINTKVASFSRREPGKDKPYDQARLRDNFFKEGSTVKNEQLSKSKYLNEFYLATNKQEAKKVFEEQEKRYSKSPYFYLDIFSFFKNEFDDKEIRKGIGKKIEEEFATNPTILKAFAYKLDEVGDFKWAAEIYKKVFILRPHYAQSYMDLANNYRDLNDADNAARLYARYNYLVDKSFFKSSESFSPIIKKEFNNLLVHHSTILSDKTFLKTEEEEFKGTRLVFEWNNGEAEFELQFVNPERQYFTWKHTMVDNAERIQDEKIHGFSCQEYLIYEPEKGKWNVNVKYLGNKSLTPTFLKANVYYNFGSTEQRKETKVFKLETKNVNRALFQINNGVSISLN